MVVYDPPFWDWKVRFSFAPKMFPKMSLFTSKPNLISDVQTSPKILNIFDLDLDIRILFDDLKYLNDGSIQWQFSMILDRKKMLLCLDLNWLCFLIQGDVCTSDIKLVYQKLPNDKKTDTISNHFKIVNNTNCYSSFKTLQTCGLRDFRKSNYHQLM